VGFLRFLFLEDGSKLIAPTHIARMNFLQRHELLAGRPCIAAELCQEIKNATLLGDLLFRDVHLSNSLNEIVHDGLSVHLTHKLPLIRTR